MKNVKKLASLLLVLGLMLSLLSVTASADDSGGSITVSNATVGVTYQAYKILDATISGEKIAYTTTESLKSVIGAEGSPFKVSDVADANGHYSVTVPESTAGATINSWITAHLGSFTAISASSGTDASDKATASQVSFTGLDYGYYYVTSGLGAEVTVDSTNPNVTVYDKNTQAPSSLGKKITAEDAVIDVSDQTTLSTASNDAAVGTTQSYTVTFNATNWVTGTSETGEIQATQVTQYTIVDTPTYLTIDKSSVQVVVTDATGPITVIKDGAVLDDENHPATIKLEGGAEAPLTVELGWVKDGESIYQAKDGQAAIQVTLTYRAKVLAGAAEREAVNIAEVKYNTNESVGMASTTTYTYQFQLNKVDENGAPLTGAKFALYLGTEQVKLVAVEGGYRVAEAGESGADTTIDMTNASQVVIKGLDKQDYTLKEIQAPDGYNLLDTAIPVSEDTLVKAMDPITETNGIVTVQNKKGTKLPSTGGMGTTIFYIVGAVLVLGAVVLLVTRRRMHNSER